MTDREIRAWAVWQRDIKEWTNGAEALAELLAYRKAARKLRKAYGMAGPARSGSLTLGVCDVLAVGRK